MKKIWAVVMMLILSIIPVYGSDAKMDELEQKIMDLQRLTQQLQSELHDLKSQRMSSVTEPSGSSEEGVRFLETGEPFDESGALARTPMYRLSEMDVKIADMKKSDLYMGLDTVGRYQIIGQDNVFITSTSTVKNADGTETKVTKQVKKDDIEPGFQTAFGNMSFLMDYENKVDVYFDIYIASKGHPSTMYGHEGYILLRDLPDSADGLFIDPLFDWITLKAGAFDIDFGDQQYFRSNNASVQRNPLIGNHVLDPSSEELGIEIFSKPHRINWLLGLTSGTTTGDFKHDRGLGAIHAKIWGDIIEEHLRTSASVYRVDHSNNLAKPDGTGSSIFNSNRSGGSYGGAFDDSNGVGEVNVGKGQDVTAGQFDITFDWNDLKVYSDFGYAQDVDTNGSLKGSPQDSWFYYAIEPSYYLTSKLYVAFCYSGAAADQLQDVSSDGLVHRFQVGGGYWIMEGLLFKLEYVNEFFSDFTKADGQVSGVDSWEDPSFDGVISEVSYSF